MRKKLKEGGPRRHIPQEVKDRFIHAVLLMPEAEDRQNEVNEIFEEIKQANVEAWMKAHPEMSKPEATEKVEDKMKDQIKDKIKESDNPIFNLTLREAHVAEFMEETFGPDENEWSFDAVPEDDFYEESDEDLDELSDDTIEEEIEDEELEDINDDLEEEIIEEDFDEIPNDIEEEIEEDPLDRLDDGDFYDLGDGGYDDFGDEF